MGYSVPVDISTKHNVEGSISTFLSISSPVKVLPLLQLHLMINSDVEFPVGVALFSPSIPKYNLA